MTANSCYCCCCFSQRCVSFFLLFFFSFSVAAVKFLATAHKITMRRRRRRQQARKSAFFRDFTFTPLTTKSLKCKCRQRSSATSWSCICNWLSIGFCFLPTYAAQMSIECDSYLQQVAIEKSFDLNVNALRAVMDL